MAHLFKTEEEKKRERKRERERLFSLYAREAVCQGTARNRWMVAEREEAESRE